MKAGDHRPRRDEISGSRTAHRRRLHHRRHPGGASLLSLRRRSFGRSPGPRSRSSSRKEGSNSQAVRRPDRGGVLQGTLGDARTNIAEVGFGQAGRCRGPHRNASPELTKLLGRCTLPHELRPERAGALDRMRRTLRRCSSRAGRSAKQARRAALTANDIGKSVSHEMEGPQRARRRRRSRAAKGGRRRVGARDGGTPHESVERDPGGGGG